MTYLRVYTVLATNISVCYTCCGALAGIRNDLVGSPGGIKLENHCTIELCYEYFGCLTNSN